MVDNKKQEVQDLLTNHFGCKSYDFDCLEILLRKADCKLDEILEHKIIQFKKDDYKNIFQIAHSSESKLRVKDIAKVATSYEIVRGLRKQDYKVILNEIVSNRKWDVLEILLSKGKDPDGKPVTNYFLDNIDGEMLLDEVIENGNTIPNDIFSKIMNGMREATEGLFKNKLTDALNAMKDHEFIDLCAKSIESTLELIIYLVPQKFAQTLFSIGAGSCEQDLKNVIDRITLGKDGFQNFMLKSHTLVASGKKGEMEVTRQFSVMPDFIKECVENAIGEDAKIKGEDAKIKDLKLVSILFDKLSGDKLEILLSDGLFARFLNKFFNVENLKNPEFADTANKIVMNIDNNIFKKLFSDTENNKFKDFLSKFFEKLSAEELIEYSYNYYVKKGHDAIFKYLLDNKFKLNDTAGKIHVEEASLLGKKINDVLLQGCINQNEIVQIFANSEYLTILKQEDDYIDSLFTTISTLANSKSLSNTRSLIAIKNYIAKVFEDQELSKTVNKALEQAVKVDTRDESQPILQLIGGTAVDMQELYKFKSLFSLMDSLKNNKGILECQTKFNKQEGELSKCIIDLKGANDKLSVHDQYRVDATPVYKVHSGGNFADQFFTFCSGASIALIGAGTYVKMSVSAAGGSAAKTSALDAAGKLLIAGGVAAVCIPAKIYLYFTSASSATQITKVENNEKKQFEADLNGKNHDSSATHIPTSKSAESSHLSSDSDDLSGTPGEMHHEAHQNNNDNEL